MLRIHDCRPDEGVTYTTVVLAFRQDDIVFLNDLSDIEPHSRDMPRVRPVNPPQRPVAS
ncbi:hypothetical protein [Bradyrhizobium embrapense]